MKRVRVQCTFEVIVEMPDDANVHFVIEDNGCPGTGAVGAELDRLIVEHDAANTCWACACKGENRVLEVLDA